MKDFLFLQKKKKTKNDSKITSSNRIINYTVGYNFIEKINKFFNKYKIFSNNLLKFSNNRLLIIFLFINIFLITYVFLLIFKIKDNQLFSYEANNYESSEFPLFLSDKKNELKAKSAVVFEKDSRVVVYKKNETLRFSPASSAKIMTAIISLENYNPESILQVTDISKIEGSKMNLVNGERIRVIDLLYGLLLPSGNDAAYILALNMEGGVSSFVEKMNEKAKELKLYNTYFVDSSGLDDKNYTTAYDLVRLSSYALNNKIFSEIVSTKEKIVYSEDYAISHRLENINKLLYQKGVTGIKTGFTEEAGGVLVTSIIYNGKTYIIVVLKSEDRFSDTQEIIASVINEIKLIKY